VSLRLARIADQPGTIKVAGPSADAIAAIDLAAFRPGVQLFVGFYNKSGSRPDADDFGPAASWTDKDRESIGLSPRSRRRIGMPSTSLARPFRGPDRVAIAALEPSGSHGHYVATATVRADARFNYVTHFTIGGRDGRILFAGMFDHAMPVIGGQAVKFGIDLGAPALPAPHVPHQLSE